MEQVTEGLHCKDVTLWIDRIGKSLKFKTRTGIPSWGESLKCPCLLSC